MRGLIFWQTEEKLEVEEKHILHPNLDDGREWKRIFATSWFIACKSRPKRSISNAVAKQHFYFQWKIHSAFWSAFQSLEIKSWGLEGFFSNSNLFKRYRTVHNLDLLSKNLNFATKFEDIFEYLILKSIKYLNFLPKISILNQNWTYKTLKISIFWAAKLNSLFICHP